MSEDSKMSVNPTQEKPTDMLNNSPDPPVLDKDADDDGFDANEYVRQLIARMDGEDSTSATPATEPATPRSPEKPASRESTRRFRDPRSPDAKATQANQPRSFVPSSSASNNSASSTGGPGGASREEQFGIRNESTPRSTQEVNVDLEKLREAVNLTTSNALRTFDCSNLLRKSFTELFTATFAIALATILATMSAAAFSLAHVFSILLLGFAAFVTFRYWRTTAVLWKHAKQNQAVAQSK